MKNKKGEKQTESYYKTETVFTYRLDVKNGTITREDKSGKLKFLNEPCKN